MSVDERYNGFTVAEFLDDPAFIGYIKRGEGAVEWGLWLQTGPSSLAAFEDASLYLRSLLGAERIRPAAGVSELVLVRVNEEISRAERGRGRIVMLRRFAVAAAVLLVIVGGGWFYYTDRVTIATGNAQQQQVILPDQSIITLNANSSVSYYRAWRWHGREVWLKGEALFEVRHAGRDSMGSAPVAERFTAHAGRVSVEVLGTRFNIRQRRRQVEVALLEGRIRVRDGYGREPAMLSPGEAVRYEDSTARFTPIGKLSNQPQAWVDHTIQASGMTVQEIIDTYEDMYGHRIVLGNPAQATRRIDGTISITSEEGILYTLANILNANIQRQGDLIYLQPK